MSTTTTIKRVALVAVAALGFGMLSVVPSSAAVVANTLTIDSATDSITLGESAPAVLTSGFVTTNVSDSVTITAIKTSGNAVNAGTVRIGLSDSSTSASVTAGLAATSPDYNYTSVSGTSALALLAGTVGERPDSLTVASTQGANRSVNSTFAVTLQSPAAAGTYVIQFYMTTSNSGAATVASTTVVTWTVTVAAADSTAVGSSTSTIRSGAATAAQGTTATTDSTVVASKSSTRATQDATIYIVQKNAAAATLTGGTDALRGESMTVTVSGGVAWVTTGTSATRPTSGTVATLANGGSNAIYVWSNGTAGVATITTTTYSGLLIGTETVTFTGAVTKLAVTKSYNTMTNYGSIVRSGGKTSGNLVEITATDAGARPIDGLTLTCVSGDATVITGCTVTAAADGTGEYFLAFTSAANSTSGKKATVTVRTVDPAVTTSTAYLTTTVDLTLGGVVATEVITLHDDKLALKSTFAPGEGMVIAITAKDASGNPVYDGALSPNLTANKQLGGLGSLGSGSYYGGQYLSRTTSAGVVLQPYNLFAPAAPGAFTISGLSGNATASLISVTATVSDDGATAAAKAASDVAQAATDAAAEATDAANAATDAANAAAEAADAATAAAQDAADAVAALSAQVASLISGLKAQLTSLTNLVIKIQKKVKA